jgi:hypothetical protein
MKSFTVPSARKRSVIVVPPPKAKVFFFILDPPHAPEFFRQLRKARYCLLEKQGKDEGNA